MKRLIYLPIFLFLGLQMQAQGVTMIPDSVFEQTLIDKGIDSDNTVNGQILTSDAEAVTSLFIDEFYLETRIQDLTGIEAFVNIDTLIVNGTYIDSLDVTNLTQLKYLDVYRNRLSDLDLSNNPLLAYLNVSSGEDVFPVNRFEKIDLSHNPKIDTLLAVWWASPAEINLNNGNNKPGMYMAVGLPAGPETAQICIKVDDPQAAQNNDFPYSEWEISTTSGISFTDDLEACALGVPQYDQTALQLYPNPAREAVHVTELTTALTIAVYNLSGQRLLHQTLSPTDNRLQIEELPTGVYLYKMIRGDHVVKTGKLVKE